MNIKRAIKKEMKRARELHPDWPKDQVHQVSTVAEEALKHYKPQIIIGNQGQV